MSGSKHQSQTEKPELRIVLLGMTGVGKSESGNTILGRKSFWTNLSSGSVTDKCMLETREFDGQTLSIVDTPGLFHTKKDHKALMKELLECVMITLPGPHVFLLVISLDAFREGERKMLEVFEKVWKDAKPHTIVLFTRGDQTKADAFINKNAAVKTFIDQLCVTYHVFDNKVQDESQVLGLLQKISNVVQRNGRSCYSNDLFKKAVNALKEEMECSEVKSESDAKESFMMRAGSFISENLAIVEEQVPGLRLFMGILEKVSSFFILGK